MTLGIDTIKIMITITEAARCSLQKVSNTESEPKVISEQKAMNTTRHIRLIAITRASCLLKDCREVSVTMIPEFIQELLADVRVFMTPFLPAAHCLNIGTCTEPGADYARKQPNSLDLRLGPGLAHLMVDADIDDVGALRAFRGGRDRHDGAIRGNDAMARCDRLKAADIDGIHGMCVPALEDHRRH